MENVLVLPVKKQKTSVYLKVANLVKLLLSKSDRDFQIKIKILKRASYFWYLREIFKNRQSGIVDLPEFLYFTGKTINTEAMRNAEWAVDEAKKLGKRHINRCFKRYLKSI